MNKSGVEDKSFQSKQNQKPTLRLRKLNLRYPLQPKDVELADHVDSLHKAFTNERGVNEQFRKELLRMVRTLLQKGVY
jgi:hypothetical protein